MRTLRSALLALVVALVAGALGTGTALADTVVIDSVDTPATGVLAGQRHDPQGRHRPLRVRSGDRDPHGHVDQCELDDQRGQGAQRGADLTHLRHRGHVHVRLQRPQRHDRVDHGLRHAGRTRSPRSSCSPRPRPSGTTRSRRASRRSRRSARPTASRSTRPRTAAQFTDANLAQYDVVVFLSTTGDVLNDAQQTAFEHYIQAGGGYVGHPRRLRHRVHVALVRPDARRLLPQPPGRNADRDGRHRGRQRALHDRSPGPLGARRTSGTTSSRRRTPWSAAISPASRLQPARRAAFTCSPTVDESTYDEVDDSAAGRRPPDRLVHELRRRPRLVHGDAATRRPRSPTPTSAPTSSAA